MNLGGSDDADADVDWPRTGRSRRMTAVSEYSRTGNCSCRRRRFWICILSSQLPYKVPYCDVSKQLTCLFSCGLTSSLPLRMFATPAVLQTYVYICRSRNHSQHGQINTHRINKLHVVVYVQLPRTGVAQDNVDYPQL